MPYLRKESFRNNEFAQFFQANSIHGGKGFTLHQIRIQFFQACNVMYFVPTQN